MRGRTFFRFFFSVHKLTRYFLINPCLILYFFYQKSFGEVTLSFASEDKMATVCIPFRVTFSPVKNGSYFFDGCEACVQMAKLIVQAIEPSNIIVGDSEYKCLKLIKQNLSDVSYGVFEIKEEPLYSVPVVQEASTLGFLSGYEVTEYIKNQTNQTYSNLGLLENVTAFDFASYLTIIFLFATMWLIKWTSILVRSRRARKVLMAEMKCAFFLKKRLGRSKRKWPQPKWLTLLRNLLFFFIGSIFCSLYRVSQVVTERPNVIVDYESLIKSNASIVSFFTVNAESYLKPSTMSTKTDNWAFRLYNYYHGGHSISGKDFKSNYLEKNGLFGYFSYNYHVAKLLVDGKIVLFTHFYTAQNIKLRHCGVSNENEFFRTFVFKDPLQREILVGSAFQAEFKSPRLTRRLRNLFEFGSTYPFGSNYIQYIDKWFDQKAGLVSQEHRRQQKEFCMDEKIEAYTKEDTFASDVRFFEYFCFLLAGILLVAFYVFISENFRINLLS